MVKNRLGPGLDARPSAGAPAADIDLPDAELGLWAARLGTTDRRLLLRTFEAADGMRGVSMKRAALDKLSTAHMRRLPFERSFPRASRPLEVTHMDVGSISKYDLPTGEDGGKMGMRYFLVCVDDHSRHKRVYFCKKKDQVPDLIIMYFRDMGSNYLFGSHLVLHRGFQSERVHTDGGLELNSQRVSDILLSFGLAATVTSAPDTPSSNGVAERAIQTLMRDAIARLMTSGVPIAIGTTLCATLRLRATDWPRREWIVTVLSSSSLLTSCFLGGAPTCDT